jgi:16S rRNA (uracil1498-N3)-methyltransferase
VVVGRAVYVATVCSRQDPVRVRLVVLLEGPAAGAAYQVQVGVVQALTRSALVDQVLEKATEVGAAFFVLVQAGGSPHGRGDSPDERLIRWRRIVLEAAKQSKQVEVPWVETAPSPGRAIDMMDDGATLSLVLEPDAETPLWERIGPGHPGTTGSWKRIALWIGPEGGWTPGELSQFETAGLETVRLGRSILRAETAGPVAVAVARLSLRDW